MSSSLGGLILITTCLLLYSICLWGKNKVLLISRNPVREKMNTLRGMVAGTIEEGTTVHCDISTTDENTLNGSSLTGLRTVRVLSAQLSAADEPLQVTNNQGALTFFNREAIQNGFQQTGMENEFEQDASVFLGYSPLTHQAGLIAQRNSDQTALHLNLGTFGAEIALQDLGLDSTTGLIAAGENLTAQAVAFVTADESFIGEELFELAEGLKTEPGQDTGLVVMDILRIGLIIALLGGSVLAILS